MKFGIRQRIIYSFLLLTTASLSFLGLYLLGFFYEQNLDSKTTHLVTNAKIVETALEDTIVMSERKNTLEEEIKKISGRTNLRITILDAGGNVVTDTWGDAESLDNHADRDEIREIPQQDYATAIRYSATTRQNMLYAAVPVYHAGKLTAIVRTATTLTPIETAYQQTRAFILSAILFTMCLTLLIGIWLTRLYTKPIAAMTTAARKIAGGAWDTRIHIRTNDELGMLAHTINQLTANLEEKLTQIDAEAKKLALILENMDNAVLLLDSYGNVSTANLTAKEMFHLTPDLLGKHSISVIGNSILTETAQEVLSARQSKSINLKLKLNHAQKTFQIFFAPIINHEGVTTGVLSVFHDISVLQEVYDRQVEFVANASHELATPLTAIRGFSETLLDGALENADLRKKFVEIIYTESKRMSRLIHDLLQLAKLDTKEYRKQVKLEQIDISEVFEAVQAKLTPQLAEKDLQWRTSLPDEKNYVQANYDWLVQVMVNLVENAIKYTPPQGKISVSCRKTSEKIFISVKDSGSGIAPQDLPFIFDRFYRADRARARSAGGSGIGLSLVRFIIEMFGGEITAESQLGLGTTFTFYLPVK